MLGPREIGVDRSGWQPLSQTYRPSLGNALGNGHPKPQSGYVSTHPGMNRWTWQAGGVHPPPASAGATRIPVAHEDPEERRVVDQVSPPESPWLAYQTVSPL
jgi:hypothetical protein